MWSAFICYGRSVRGRNNGHGEPGGRAGDKGKIKRAATLPAPIILSSSTSSSVAEGGKPPINAVTANQPPDIKSGDYFT